MNVVTEDLMRQAFAALDTDNDGFITTEDIKRAIKLRGLNQDASGLFQPMDPSRVGRAGLSDFMMGVAELELDVSLLIPPPVEEKATLEQIKQAFDAISRDGVVHVDLIAAALQRQDPNATEEEASTLLEMMKQVDESGMGDVHFSGFVKIVADLSLDVLRFLPPEANEDTSLDPTEVLHNIFDFYDEQGTGVIPSSQIPIAVKKWAPSATDQDIQHILQAADRNAEGVVSAQDFVKAVSAYGNSSPDVQARLRKSKKRASLKADRRPSLNHILDQDTLQRTQDHSWDLEDLKAAWEAISVDGDVTEESVFDALIRINADADESDAADMMQVLVAQSPDGDIGFGDFVKVAAAMHLDIAALAARDDKRDAPMHSQEISANTDEHAPSQGTDLQML